MANLLPNLAFFFLTCSQKDPFTYGCLALEGGNKESSKHTFIGVDDEGLI